jgi:hypothetical protein
MYLFSKAFWAYAGDRALKTGAQVIIAGVTVSTFAVADGSAWVIIGQTAGVAVLVSILTSLTAYSAASGTESTPTSTVSAPAASVPLFTVGGQK